MKKTLVPVVLVSFLAFFGSCLFTYAVDKPEIKDGMIVFTGENEPIGLDELQSIPESISPVVDKIRGVVWGGQWQYMNTSPSGPITYMVMQSYNKENGEATFIITSSRIIASKGGKGVPPVKFVVQGKIDDWLVITQPPKNFKEYDRKYKMQLGQLIKKGEIELNYDFSPKFSATLTPVLNLP
jgi:hypothetical protein